MSLGVLGIFVVVGLLSVLAALFAFGFTQPLTLTPETAEREFNADNPGKSPRVILISQNGQAALIDADDRYILWSMGADAASWKLSGARITETDQGLVLRLPDYAAPRVRLTLGDTERIRWKTLIEEAA